MSEVGRRAVLFVHAHPDDESLATGISLAHLSAAGHDVRVLTMTLGEEGEVIPPELRHLAADAEDRLGPYRREELRSAMQGLGVAHRVLGEDPGSGVLSLYRDSGMAGTPSAERPEAFANADVDEVAALVAEEITAVAPAAVVTYDRHGGYLHPDHVQTHRVTCAAVASLLPQERPALYAVLSPLSWVREDREWLAGQAVPREHGWSVPPLDAPYPPSAVADQLVTHEIVDPSAVARQVAALRAHRTQVTVVDGCYALSNDIAARLSGREGFAPLDPATGHHLPPQPRSVGDEGGGAAGRHTGLVEDET